MAAKLMYVFARIEGDKLVEDPDHPGHDFGGSADDWDSFVTPLQKEHGNIISNWILLVPQNPIPCAPSSTFWNRVATDSVEYNAGKWTNWIRGRFPAPLPNIGAISVFIVPIAQYEQLNENISKPSLVIGRPKSDDYYPIPISLLQSEFAEFKQDIVSGPLDQTLSPLAYRWKGELSQFFADVSLREAKFHELLSELFDGFNVSKKNIGNYTTDRGIDLLVVPLLVKTQPTSDALFEIAFRYLEGTRRILADDAFKGEWRKTRLPSLLIIHNGLNIQAMGAVNTTEAYVEPLSPSIPLHFNGFDTVSMMDLIRFMTALRRLFRSLEAIYQNPNIHAVDPDQSPFPYIRSYKSPSGAIVAFKYIERLSEIRLVFTARTEDDCRIIVKFGYGHYGVDAHKAAVQSGLAPALLNYTNLAGGWWMVVMKPLEDDFKPCDEFKDLEKPCKIAIEEALSKFHKLGFVHGDFRDVNVFLRFYDGQWECQIIDFDWAGREGEVVYPIGVYFTWSVWRPERYMDGKLITSDHDIKTMKEFLFRRYKLGRWE